MEIVEKVVVNLREKTILAFVTAAQTGIPHTTYPLFPKVFSVASSGNHIFAEAVIIG